MSEFSNLEAEKITGLLMRMSNKVGKYAWAGQKGTIIRPKGILR